MNSEAETIINKSDTDDILKSIYIIIRANNQNFLEKLWVGLLIQLQITLLMFVLVGSSYAKLLEELNHPKKGLINIQSFDDYECSKWFLVEYLHPAYHFSARI